MKAHLSPDGKASTGKLLAAACVAGGLGGVAGNPAGEFIPAGNRALLTPCLQTSCL